MRWSRTVTVIDAHAEGEIGRVITGGVVAVPGRTMLDKMRHLNTADDSIRRFALFEPRGSAQMSANLLLPPTRPDADAGFLVMQADACHAMSGSNAICVTTVLLETGMLPMVEPVTRVALDTPGGAGDRAGRLQGGPLRAGHARSDAELRRASGPPAGGRGPRPGAGRRRLWRRLLLPGRRRGLRLCRRAGRGPRHGDAGAPDQARRAPADQGPPPRDPRSARDQLRDVLRRRRGRAPAAQRQRDPSRPPGPLALRHRHRRPPRGDARQGRARRSARSSSCAR